MDPFDVVPNPHGLGCPRCHIKFEVDEVDYTNECNECRAGLVPLGPGCAPVNSKYQKVRNGLQDHAVTLGLRHTHIVIIYALARHERVTGQWVYPSIQTLANLSGMSKSTAKRTMAELHAAGHVLKHDRGRSPDGGRETSAWCMSPLWNRIDALVSRPVTLSHVKGGWGQNDPTLGSERTYPGVRLTSEVDVVEVNKEEHISAAPSGVSHLRAV